jgi:UDP-N-acetylmuramoyl-tripeptide--D-alanyl-D-alanine ligase
MIEITVAKLAEIVGGVVHGDPETTVTAGVETDSRLITPGSLFFAKPGEFADGHDFVTAAIDRGAVAAVTERPLEIDTAHVVVPNTVVALGQLAGWLVSTLRSKSELKVVGITGSNGKTTTKNMLGAILPKLGETISPVDSFNNKVGAPISILRAGLQTKFLIVEMGAAGIGSIEYLAKMVNPDIGVILKVGLAHAGEFGGIENTAKIKGELAVALNPSAKLVLNADDNYVRNMSQNTKAEVFWFGSGEEASFRASDIELSASGTSFILNWPDGTGSRVTLRILGEHHIMNALAAAAVATLLGASKQQIISALEQLELAERWRMQKLVRPDGVVIINDAYNASPDSTKAALQTLAQLGKLGTRTIAVLGEMAELGEYSKTEHDAMGRLVVRLNIDQLVVVGHGAKLIHMGASQEGSWDGESKYFDRIDDALEYLRGILTDGDTVLVKSSKSANLRFLGDQLMESGN